VAAGQLQDRARVHRIAYERQKSVSQPAILVEHLVKTYKPRRQPPVQAVDDLSFSVREGSIFGLLGPNGAGKTTTLRIMTTLTRATSGRVEVLGHDVGASPLEVRKRIGVVIQEHAADLLLNARDNLLTFARFHGIAGRVARSHADDVMAQFGIGDVATRKVQDLSGGMRRRVQVAKMFMVEVPLVFLDEFSTGMDPILKRSVMDLLRSQVATGRTIVLTTQILTEAEELCDDILIINRGRRVAHGDLHSLKLLTDRLYDVTLSFDRVPDGLAGMLAGYDAESVKINHNTVQLRLRDEEARVLELVASLSRHGRILRVEIAGASLEDVFVELTQQQAGANR